MGQAWCVVVGGMTLNIAFRVHIFLLHLQSACMPSQAPQIWFQATVITFTLSLTLGNAGSLANGSGSDIGQPVLPDI